MSKAAIINKHDGEKVTTATFTSSTPNNIGPKLLTASKYGSRVSLLVE
jgi:hypothetical protein